MTNNDKAQQAIKISYSEHNDLLRRISSAISGFFEPVRASVKEIELPPSIQNRSAAEVLAFLPVVKAEQRVHSPRVCNNTEVESEKEEEITTAR